MITDSPDESLAQRIQASVGRVVSIRGFSCSEENGKLVMRGEVASRDDALMCLVIARSVPGGNGVVSQVKVVR